MFGLKAITLIECLLPPVPKSDTPSEYKRSTTPLGSFIETTKADLIESALKKIFYALKESASVNSSQPETLSEQLNSLFARIVDSCNDASRRLPRVSHKQSSQSSHRESSSAKLETVYWSYCYRYFLKLQLIILDKFGMPTMAFKSSSSSIQKLAKDDPAFIKYQQNKLFTFLKSCLKISPSEDDSTAIRCLTIKVLFKSNFSHLAPLTKDEVKPQIEQSPALVITRKLINDQDYKVRCVYLENLIECLPKLYMNN